MVVCCVGPFSYEGKNREAILDNVQDGETAL